MSEQLQEAMTWLGERTDALFLGQGVGAAGTKMSSSFAGVPAEKKIEFPVAENLQLGVSIGLALEGFVPVSVFPRWNFLILAADQLVQHLDRLPLYSGYKPKVIIRTSVGSKFPLDAGVQHTDDYSEAFRLMLRTIMVVQSSSEEAVQTYQSAYNRQEATLVVESK